MAHVVEEWLSWTAITAKDGAALVAVQIRQGKLETRPHSELDHDDPSTKELPEAEQLEYKHVTENTVELKGTIKKKDVTTGSKQEPQETATIEDVELAKKNVQKARKQHNADQAALNDMKLQLPTYEKSRYIFNPYVSSKHPSPI